jgi:hypothetical protein
MVNRTQGLVLGFGLLAWASLVVILLIAPDVYEETLRLSDGDLRLSEFAFLTGLSALLLLLGVGVLRRWHWLFWLLLVAFLAGALRPPAAVLQLAGIVPTTEPAWYVVVQALVGLLQVAIGLLMLVGYRRAAVWGAF